MKNILIIALFAILSLSACTATQTEKTETKPSAPADKPKTDDGGTKTEEKKPDESSTAGIKPSDIDPNKPFKAEELKKAIAADFEAWKGKEVTLNGSFGGQLKSGGKTSIYVVDAARKNLFKCVSSEAVPEGVLYGTTYKGTVKEQSAGWIVLEPCSPPK